MIEITVKRLYQIGWVCFVIGGVCQLVLINLANFWTISLTGVNVVFSFTVAGFFLSELWKMKDGESKVLSEAEIKEMFNKKD